MVEERRGESEEGSLGAGERVSWKTGEEASEERRAGEMGRG